LEELEELTIQVVHLDVEAVTAELVQQVAYTPKDP
jgi:hypothetical protein